MIYTKILIAVLFIIAKDWKLQSSMRISVNNCRFRQWETIQPLGRWGSLTSTNLELYTKMCNEKRWTVCLVFCICVKNTYTLTCPYPQNVFGKMQVNGCLWGEVMGCKVMCPFLTVGVFTTNSKIKLLTKN